MELECGCWQRKKNQRTIDERLKKKYFKKHMENVDSLIW